MWMDKLENNQTFLQFRAMGHGLPRFVECNTEIVGFVTEREDKDVGDRLTEADQANDTTLPLMKATLLE